MATTNPHAGAFDTSANTRERQYDLAQSYKAILARMIAGEMNLNAPWADPRFCEMVNRELALHGEWKLAAEKLAIVKEVFGGKS